MDKNYDAIMKLADNLGKVLFEYATEGLDSLSSDEIDTQMTTCLDIADFIIFAFGADVTISDDGESFTVAGKFGNYAELLEKFLK